MSIRLPSLFLAVLVGAVTLARRLRAASTGPTGGEGSRSWTS